MPTPLKRDAKRWLVKRGGYHIVKNYAASASVLTDKQKRKIRDLFRSLDKDNSGAIDMEELRQGIKAVHMDTSMVNDFMAEADEDANADVDFDEFVALITRFSESNFMDLQEERSPTNILTKLMEFIALYERRHNQKRVFEYLGIKHSDKIASNMQQAKVDALATAKCLALRDNSSRQQLDKSNIVEGDCWMNIFSSYHLGKVEFSNAIDEVRKTMRERATWDKQQRRNERKEKAKRLTNRTPISFPKVIERNICPYRYGRKVKEEQAKIYEEALFDENKDADASFDIRGSMVSAQERAKKAKIKKEAQRHSRFIKKQESSNPWVGQECKALQIKNKQKQQKEWKRIQSILDENIRSSGGLGAEFGVYQPTNVVFKTRRRSLQKHNRKSLKNQRLNDTALTNVDHSNKNKTSCYEGNETYNSNNLKPIEWLRHYRKEKKKQNDEKLKGKWLSIPEWHGWGKPPSKL